MTQIVCDPNMSGCFQYLTGRAGVILIHAPNYVSNSLGMITSFNFWNTDTTRQLHLGKIKFSTKSDLIDIFNSNISAAMDYTICLRRETGHCCLLCDKKKGEKYGNGKNFFSAYLQQI